MQFVVSISTKYVEGEANAVPQFLIPELYLHIIQGFVTRTATATATVYFLTLG